MACVKKITFDDVYQLLNYNPKTGDFVWKKRNDVPQNWNTKYSGKKAGSKNIRGYIQIRINNKIYYAHVLAYLLMTGILPKEDIDHINRIKDDNRWSNLRLANGKNSANASLRSDSTTGFKGVSYCSEGRLYRAQIFINKKIKHLGTFKTPEAAHDAYIKAAKEYWGDFACSG